MIDLVVAEYARLHPDRHKPASQFSDEMIALCSLIDRSFPQFQATAVPHMPEVIKP